MDVALRPRCLRGVVQGWRRVGGCWSSTPMNFQWSNCWFLRVC